MHLSVIIPFYNEEKNVSILFEELKSALSAYSNWEIIAVDDGSTDSTLQECKKINKTDNRFKVISLRKNYGQSAVLAADFNMAKGSIIVTLDGDLQNNPADIPDLIEQLNNGYDIAIGWRHKRKDPFMKKIFSLTGRFMRRLILKDRIAFIWYTA